MTRVEIVEKLAVLHTDTTDLNTQITHPAFDLFVTAMEEYQYGVEPLSSAWEWFREGWDSA